MAAVTMNTRFHIAKPVDAERLFLHILAVLESDPLFVPSWTRPTDERGPWRTSPGPLALGKATYKHVRKGDVRHVNEKTGRVFYEDDNEFRTTLGQGLAAIWEVTYAADGPLVWPPYEYDEPGDPPNEDPMRIHLVSGNFDTAYGYRLPNGAGCADLHAFLLREVGVYLAGLGVDEWVWHHEERGTWHVPVEIPVRGDPNLVAPHFDGCGPAK